MQSSSLTNLFKSSLPHLKDKLATKNDVISSLTNRFDLENIISTNENLKNSYLASRAAQ